LEFNYYSMPLSFVRLPARAEALVLNAGEKKFLSLVEELESDQDDPTARYSVTVNVEVRIMCSKAKDALGVQTTNNPDEVNEGSPQRSKIVKGQ